MHIQKLSLLNFKNFQVAELNLSKGINCIAGNNGAGKTNLLDAVYYLSFCKSYFNTIDSQNITDGAPFFVIQGKYLYDNKPYALTCSLKKGEKKIFKNNDKEYKRLSEHIGLFPLVIISPSDVDYINEGSDVRRKYIDSVLVQFDKIYLENLVAYNKALLQRNYLLKRFFENNYFDRASLEIWDDKLLMLGQKIFDKRLAFIKEFVPLFRDFYHLLSGGHEQVAIRYESQLLKGPFTQLMAAAINNDRKALYTTVGIHKDDLLFTKDDKPLKKFGSQGQQKTFLIALKLAQYSVTKDIKKVAPLLLLDDIFDKLDNKRVAYLIELVSKNGFEQVIITDTDLNRMRSVLEQVNLPAKFFMVEDQNVKEV